MRHPSINTIGDGIGMTQIFQAGKYYPGEYPQLVAMYKSQDLDTDGNLVEQTISRHDVEMITLKHYRTTGFYNAETGYLGGINSRQVVPGFTEPLEIPCSSVLLETVPIANTDAFVNTGIKPFDYMFFIPPDSLVGKNFFPESGKYQTEVEIERKNNMPPVSFLFLSECRAAVMQSVGIGESPNFVAEIDVKFVDDASAVTRRNLIRDFTRDVLVTVTNQYGTIIEGWNRNSIGTDIVFPEKITDETTLDKLFSGSGFSKFPISWSWRPPNPRELFPNVGEYFVKFETFAKYQSEQSLNPGVTVFHVNVI